MKRKIFLRCMIGAPLGLAISTLITILISLLVGDGNYYPVVPELAEDCGSELAAVLVQALCSLLYGAAWGGASVIWELEQWSLLRQSLTHLAACSLATFPIAYLMQWMPHSALGALLYFAIFFGIYLFLWLTQFFATKKRIQAMNDRLEGKPLE